jgi:hypothetical protein
MALVQQKVAASAALPSRVNMRGNRLLMRYLVRFMEASIIAVIPATWRAGARPNSEAGLKSLPRT